MSSSVTIARAKLDDLADAIAIHGRIPTCITISDMTSAVNTMYAAADMDDLRYEMLFKTYSDSVNYSQLSSVPDFMLAGMAKVQSISFPVATTIGQHAFDGCTSLSFVTIPSVKTIGAYAFKQCKSITSVTFSNATKVGSSAFYKCENLSYASIYGTDTIGPPVSIYISEYAFSGCDNLEEMHVCGHSVYISSHAFENCSKLSVFDANEITQLGEYAFAGCSSLTSAYVYSLYYYLGNDRYQSANYAFKDCVNLNTFAIGAINPQGIPEGFFQGCSSLTSIESDSGHGWVNIKSYAFDGCFLFTPQLSNVFSFGEGAFRSCNITNAFFSAIFSIPSYYIPKSIPSYAFQDCSNLSSFGYSGVDTVYISMVGEYAFRNCSLIQDITFCSAALEIHAGAFYNCSGINVSYSNTNLRNVGYSAFTNCDSLPSIYMPNVISISNHAFCHCINLECGLTISKCVSIGMSAFYQCSKLTDVTASNCSYVGPYCFGQCSNLVSVYLPNISFIFEGTFFGCSKLSSYDGANVKTIWSKAFAGCSSLSSISFPICTSIGNSAFQTCTSLTEVVFPNCTYIGTSAFQGCSVLSIVSFPNCSTILDDAFNGCYLLSSISLPNVTAIGTMNWVPSRNGVFKGTAIRELSLPKCTFIGSYAFQSTELLASVYITKSTLTSIGQGAFNSCPALVSFNHGHCSTIASYTYQGCTSLEYFDGSKVVYIYGSAFNGCSKLMSIYLTNSTAKTGSRYLSLAGTSQFYGTPIVDSTYTGSFGSIYVYKSAYNQVMIDATWSSYKARVVCLDP